MPDERSIHLCWLSVFMLPLVFLPPVAKAQGAPATQEARAALPAGEDLKVEVELQPYRGPGSKYSSPFFRPLRSIAFTHEAKSYRLAVRDRGRLQFIAKKGSATAKLPSARDYVGGGPHVVRSLGEFTVFEITLNLPTNGDPPTDFVYAVERKNAIGLAVFSGRGLLGASFETDRLTLFFLEEPTGRAPQEGLLLVRAATFQVPSMARPQTSAQMPSLRRRVRPLWLFALDWGQALILDRDPRTAFERGLAHYGRTMLRANATEVILGPRCVQPSCLGPRLVVPHRTGSGGSDERMHPKEGASDRADSPVLLRSEWQNLLSHYWTDAMCLESWPSPSSMGLCTTRGSLVPASEGPAEGTAIRWSEDNPRVFRQVHGQLHPEVNTPFYSDKEVTAPRGIVFILQHNGAEPFLAHHVMFTP